jgi:hypothetical protein
MIQTFPNSNSVFQDGSAPIRTAETVQSWIEEHEGELHHHPWPMNQILKIVGPVWYVKHILF